MGRADRFSPPRAIAGDIDVIGGEVKAGVVPAGSRMLRGFDAATVVRGDTVVTTCCCAISALTLDEAAVCCLMGLESELDLVTMVIGGTILLALMLTSALLSFLFPGLPSPLCCSLSLLCSNSLPPLPPLPLSPLSLLGDTSCPEATATCCSKGLLVCGDNLCEFGVTDVLCRGTDVVVLFSTATTEDGAADWMTELEDEYCCWANAIVWTALWAA